MSARSTGKNTELCRLVYHAILLHILVLLRLGSYTHFNGLFLLISLFDDNCNLIERRY